MNCTLSIVQPYNEKALISQICEGDEKAFRALFDHYRDYTFAKAYHFLKDSSKAEDILQDVFLKIWQHRSKLPEIQNFRAYLNTITRNRIYSLFRQMAGNSLLLNKLEELQVDRTENISSIALEDKELQAAFRSALNLLTNQQRKIFELSRIEGLSHNEIAEKLGMQRDTVKKHISDALHTIRQNLHRFPLLIQTGILLYVYLK